MNIFSLAVILWHQITIFSLYKQYSHFQQPWTICRKFHLTITYWTLCLLLPSSSSSSSSSLRPFCVTTATFWFQCFITFLWWFSVYLRVQFYARNQKITLLHTPFWTVSTCPVLRSWVHAPPPWRMFSYDKECRFVCCVCLWSLVPFCWCLCLLLLPFIQLPSFGSFESLAFFSTFGLFTASFANLSTDSFPGIPECAGTCMNHTESRQMIALFALPSSTHWTARRTAHNSTLEGEPVSAIPCIAVTTMMVRGGRAILTCYYIPISLSKLCNSPSD